MDKKIKKILCGKLSKWAIEVRESENGKPYVMVIDTEGFFVDYPLLLLDGRILYDFPERVPGYVKKIVENVFKNLDALVRDGA